MPTAPFPSKMAFGQERVWYSAFFPAMLQQDVVECVPCDGQDRRPGPRDLEVGLETNPFREFLEMQGGWLDSGSLSSLQRIQDPLGSAVELGHDGLIHLNADVVRVIGAPVEIGEDVPSVLQRRVGNDHVHVRGRVQDKLLLVVHLLARHSESFQLVLC
jgi:hypothetical protein